MRPRPSLAGLGRTIRDAGTHLGQHPVDALVDDSGTIINVPVNSLEPNPDQPRVIFDREALADLTQSIKTRGVLQPILVRRNGARYTIIAGERRWRAATAAGLRKIPALVNNDGKPDELALIENIQRQDLHPLEYAQALLKLKEKSDYTEATLARLMGKSRKSIDETLALNRLPESIKAEWRTSAKVQKSLVLQVLRAPNPEAQLALWQSVKNGRVTVRQMRAKAKAERSSKPGPRPYEYRFLAKDKTFSVRITFRKSRASHDEVRGALREAMKHVS